MLTSPSPSPSERAAEGSRRLRLGVLLLLVWVAVLWQAPPRDALLLRGVDHALAPLLSDEGRSILKAAGGEGAPIHVRVSWDGAPYEGAAVQRVVRAKLARYREHTGRVDPERTPLGVALALEGEGGVLRSSLHLDGAGTSAFATGSWRVPGRSALVPPLLAITLALLTGRTLWALFLGTLAGSIALAAGSGGWASAPLRGLLDLGTTYLQAELTSRFRIEIIGFIVALMGMVGVMTRAGGVQGLVERLLAVARTLRSSLLATYGMGLALFFDDYANCMLVGSTMRPLTDRLRVSREKLAYIVDSTAAPVAGLSLFSTWIAFQVSVYEAQLPGVGITASGYEIFLLSVPFRFYSWLALAFVLLVILTGRDFGPMAHAERRARAGAWARPGSQPPISDAVARMQPAPGITPDWRRAGFPVLATALVTLLWILARGVGDAPPGASGMAWLTSVLLAGSGSQSIFMGALAGFGVACALAAPHLPAREMARASLVSARTLGFAVVLLFLAWMIGAVCQDLGTADYLVALLGDVLPPAVLPVLLFVLACVVAFSTGSSWSTMSILLPNVVGLAATLGAASGLGVELMVVLCISAVLEGAIFGDHCSPISDTTVLSSVSAGSDLVDHVRTQAPYALAVAFVALTLGYLPVLLVPGWSPLLSLGLGAASLALLLRLRGDRVPPFVPGRLAGDGQPPYP